MKHLNLSLIFLLLIQISFSQQYDTVYIETDSIDSNNDIYKTGNVYVFDYEIIDNGKACKLLRNSGMFASKNYELVSLETDTLKLDRIHILVKPVSESNSSNGHQTEIVYLVGPPFNRMSSTGAVDNNINIWIHPIRDGFFNALETAPFPYVKRPLTIGEEWNDEMLIGQGWRDEKWGIWEGSLLLSYTYKTVEKVNLKTHLGTIECYVTESIASSTIGETKLKSYYSKIYGFVRLEYELLNDLKVNMWLTDYKTGQSFNSFKEMHKTNSYIKQ
ncbi:hypothetical protein [Psychroserpens algicola]|uniref:hypothetical protein n=1 Tax=Psychroserpens algicola TaxID=1719034 RepID=UPI001954E54D|nr:hypothetical protein [Psychroserpens algicola]